jgi:hypothetical protein
MKHVWKPEPIVGENGKEVEPLVEGEVEVDLPKYVQRLRYLKQAKIKLSDKGEVDAGGDPLEQAILAVELAEKHIKKVNLTVKETGKKVKSVDEMGYLPECEAALTEIGFLVLNGPPLGKR